jgi:hypothetical protein
MKHARSPSPRSPEARAIAELRALAGHAEQRLALYRRRMYLGRGDPRRLAELERKTDGARARLARATAAADPAAPTHRERT